MKYLPYESLEMINNQLACLDTGDYRIFGRIECYSCKHTRHDLKLKHVIEHKYEPSLRLSPQSPNSTLVSRKTFLFLLATLNACYPDYDFTHVLPEYFLKLPNLSLAINNVTNTLFFPFQSTTIHDAIWDEMDKVIKTKECDVYSFNPPPEAEPDGEEGNLWSFFYFFYNKSEKRIMFFTARAVSLLAPMQPEEEDLSGDVNLPDSGTPPTDSFSYEQFTMNNMDI